MHFSPCCMELSIPRQRICTPLWILPHNLKPQFWATMSGDQLHSFIPKLVLLAPRVQWLSPIFFGDCILEGLTALSTYFTRQLRLLCWFLCRTWLFFLFNRFVNHFWHCILLLWSLASPPFPPLVLYSLLIIGWKAGVGFGGNFAMLKNDAWSLSCLSPAPPQAGQLWQPG